MVTVWLATAAVIVAPPPLKGRPDDFCGGVGSFELSAGIQPSEFPLDKTVTLTLTLRGSGDFADFRAPDLTKQKSFADRFDVVGPPKKSPFNDGMRIDFPIRARSLEPTSVPSIRFSIYNDRPPRPGYRLLRSAEIPIGVLPVPTSEVVAARASEESTPPSLGSRLPLALIAFATLIAAALRTISSHLRKNPPAQRAGKGKTAAMPTRRRTQEPPTVFIRSNADGWIDKFGEALALPKGRWTSEDIVAAARARRIDRTLLISLEDNMRELDAGRFCGLESSSANAAELTAAFEAVQQAMFAPRP